MQYRWPHDTRLDVSWKSVSFVIDLNHKRDFPIRKLNDLLPSSLLSLKRLATRLEELHDLTSKDCSFRLGCSRSPGICEPANTVLRVGSLLSRRGLKPKSQTLFLSSVQKGAWGGGPVSSRPHTHSPITTTGGDRGLKTTVRDGFVSCWTKRAVLSVFSDSFFHGFGMFRL